MLISSVVDRDAGIYALDIECLHNTTAATISSDRFELVAGLAADPCSSVAVDAQPLRPLIFQIRDGTSSAFTSFAEFTNQGDKLDCGLRRNVLAQGVPGLTLDAASREFSLATTDPGVVGVNEATLLL